MRFEQWGLGPTATLFIKTASNVIRIWYERPGVLNGLDGASTTTIPPDAENLIVTGAANNYPYQTGGTTPTPTVPPINGVTNRQP